VEPCAENSLASPNEPHRVSADQDHVVAGLYLALIGGEVSPSRENIRSRCCLTHRCEK
jgi:hypothetical protein